MDELEFSPDGPQDSGETLTSQLAARKAAVDVREQKKALRKKMESYVIKMTQSNGISARILERAVSKEYVACLVYHILVGFTGA